MFVEGTTQYRPGLQAEKYVWEMVKTDFSNRKDCFGFLHFPMFKEDLSGRKEIDILLFDCKLGAIVIEVKGFKIDEITGISGHTWLLENIYTSSAEPYNQAEQQLYMLCDEMEKNLCFIKLSVNARMSFYLT
mgnify:FL=1